MEEGIGEGEEGEKRETTPPWCVGCTPLRYNSALVLNKWNCGKALSIPNTLSTFLFSFLSCCSREGRVGGSDAGSNERR
jgi:hypothetical protein